MKRFLLLIFLLFTYVGVFGQAIYIVKNTNDSGAGSLRQALLDANATPVADIINFEIPGTGPHVIALTQKLPLITRPVTIDGFSQAGASVGDLWGGIPHTIMIEVDGSGTGAVVNSVALFRIRPGAEGTIFRGISVTGNPTTSTNSGNGIHIGTNNVYIQSCYIGVRPDGLTAKGNGEAGIFIGIAAANAGNVTIGGTTGDKGNLISGQAPGSSAYNVGIYVSTTTANLLIQNNFIGTNVNGTAAIPNQNGIRLAGANNTIIKNLISGNTGYGLGSISVLGVEFIAKSNYIGTDITGLVSLPNGLLDATYGSGILSWNNSTGKMTIGGTSHTLGKCDGDCNLISGGAQEGIKTNGTVNSVIEGNFIGLDVNGNNPLGNQGEGMMIQNATNIRIGGTSDLSRNYVGGNTRDGITLFGTADGRTVINNYIGTDVTGMIGYPNLNGIRIWGTSNIGISQNLIASNEERGILITGASLNNVITKNRIGVKADNSLMPNLMQGIFVMNTSNDVSIFENRIVGNGLLGIDIDFPGPLANDAGDADTGANDRLNYPVLSDINPTAQMFHLDVPAGNYRIDFYSNPSGADPSGQGEGEIFLGTYTINGHPGGILTYNANLPFLAAAKYLSATTTELDNSADGYGATSEYSKNFTSQPQLIDCNNLTGMVYTAPAQTGATYSWTITPSTGVTYTTSGDGQSITVDWTNATPNSNYEICVVVSGSTGSTTHCYSVFISPSLIDTDGDGIFDPCDLDVENDGILNSVEGNCADDYDYLTGSWDNNSGIVGGNDGGFYDPVLSVVTPFTKGAGISSMVIAGSNDFPEDTGNATNTGLAIYGVDALDFAQAKTSNDYLQFQFTTIADFGNFYYEIDALRYAEYLIQDTPTKIGGNYSYAVEISKDNFATSQLFIEPRVYGTPGPDTIVPGLSLTFFGADYHVITGQAVQNLVLEENKTYTVRLYLFNEQDKDGKVLVDDITFDAIACDDFDGDGIPNYRDLDSDGDGCPDAIEGDGNIVQSQLNTDTSISGDANEEGIPDLVGTGQGVGSSQDTAVSVCCDPTESGYPDFDDDGVSDSCDLDNDNDGILDTAECGVPLTISSVTGNQTNSISGVYNSGPLTTNFTLSSPSLVLIPPSTTPEPVKLNRYAVTPVEGMLVYWDEGTVVPNTFELNYTLDEPQLGDLNSLRIGSNAPGSTYVAQNANKQITVTWPGGTLAVLSDPLNEILNYADGAVIASGTTLEYNSGGMQIQNSKWNLEIDLGGVSYPFTLNYKSVSSVLTRMEGFAFMPVGCVDLDGDGLPNYLDLDSDGDGCPDAIEGDGSIIQSQLNTDSSISGNVNEDGVPELAGTGQNIGNSQNAMISDCFIEAIPDINQTPVNLPVTGDLLTNDEFAGTATVTSATYADASGNQVNLPINTPTQIYGYDDVGNWTLAGTIQLNDDGTYTFTPQADFVGTVPVYYTLTNEVGYSDSALLEIEVIPAISSENDMPIAQNDTAATEAGAVVTSTVLNNDSDPDGDVLSVTGATIVNSNGNTVVITVNNGLDVSGTDPDGNPVPNAGTFVLNADGTYTFTPAPGFVGSVNPITYTVSDGNSGTDTAQLFIEVYPDNGNNTYANDDANTAPAGEEMNGNIKTNDTDPEGHSAYVTTLVINGVVYDESLPFTDLPIPGVGTFTLNPDTGVYTFTPEPDFVGTQSIEYTLCDNGTPQACDTATLYLTSLEKSVCYKPGNFSSIGLPTNVGISTLQIDNSGNWPMVREGAWIALESDKKGFVPNRLTTAQITAIPAANLVEGMMVYNISLDCLQINIDGTATGWKCFNVQSCPE